MPTRPGIGMTADCYEAAQGHPAAAAAHELLRTALLAKLAVDVGDPALARRAARRAASSARLLSGMHLPAYVDPDEDLDDDLPKLGDLLVAKYPPSPADQDAP